MRHQLYRIRDQYGRLLYIGISFDLARRLGQHAGLKPWWSEVACIDVEHHPDRRTVMAAEAAAIAAERPIHNVVGDRRFWGRMPDVGPAPFGLVVGAKVQLATKDRLNARGVVQELSLSGVRLRVAGGTLHNLRWSEIGGCWWTDGRITEWEAPGGDHLHIGHRVTEGDRGSK